MPATKGTPVSPVTVIMDTEERQVSIEGEPESKSQRVILPSKYRHRYALGIPDYLDFLLQSDPERFTYFRDYLLVSEKLDSSINSKPMSSYLSKDSNPQPDKNREFDGKAL